MVAVIATLRPPFLLLTPACMSVGVALSALPWSDGRVWLALASGLAAHAAVNGFNEVLDYRSGLDEHTRRTPFSGGSGTLPARPELMPMALGLAVLMLAVAVAGGLLLVIASGPGLLLYGALGVVLVLTYTPLLNRHPLACLLAPGLGFGPVMVAGTCHALGGGHSAAAWIASLLPFALASNLLLVNQIPDAMPDRDAGRRHLVVMRGSAIVAPVYLALALAGWGGIAAGVAGGLLPGTALYATVTFPVAIALWHALRRYHADAPALLPWMGVNVALALVTPALLAAGVRVG